MANTPKTFKVKVGSKAQVFHGNAERTTGGLKKSDLMQSKAGRIVSKKQHASGLKAINRLRKAGYVAKKGEFKLFSKATGSKKAATARRPVTRSVTAAKAATRKAAAAKAAATRKAKKLNTVKEGGRRRSATRRFW